MAALLASQRLVLENCKVSCTGFAPTMKVRCFSIRGRSGVTELSGRLSYQKLISRIVSQLGGEFMSDFTSSTSHLIASKADSAKYEVSAPSIIL